jgi:hypothetical protein
MALHTPKIFSLVCLSVLYIEKCFKQKYMFIESIFYVVCHFFYIEN